MINMELYSVHYRTIFWFYHGVWYYNVFAEFWHKTTLVENTRLNAPGGGGGHSNVKGGIRLVQKFT